MSEVRINPYPNIQRAFQPYSAHSAKSLSFCGDKKCTWASDSSNTTDSIHYKTTADLKWDIDVWAAPPLWNGINFHNSKKGLQIPAFILNKGYAQSEFRAKEEIEKTFGELGVITSRVKDPKSVFSKLVSKAKKTGKEYLSLKDCKELICDAIGTRLVFKKMDEEKVAGIVDSTLSKMCVSPKTFDRFLQGKMDSSDQQNRVLLEALNKAKEEITTCLSEEQTGDFVETLKQAIEKGDLKITELHNYAGLEGHPYLSKKQVQSIADTHFDKYQENLIVNSASDSLNKKGHKAIKESGYTTLQMNVIHRSGVLGEFQIRGGEITKLAEYEHVPYDIRRGKLFSDKSKYEEIAPTLENLSDESYSLYNKYLTNCYKHARLKELGLNVGTAPEFPKDLKEMADLSERQAYLLSQEGLSHLATTKTESDTRK